MKNIKDFVRKYAYILLVLALALFFLIYVAIIQDEGKLTIISYLFAIFSVCLAVWSVLRNSSLLYKLGDTLSIKSIGKRFISDPLYRSEMLIYQGFSVNVIYALIKFVAGVILASVWYIALSMYYICLSIIRSLLISYLRSGASTQSCRTAWGRYRNCGIMLLILNQILTVLVIYIVNQEDGFIFPGVLIYAMAGYAFYALTVAIIGMVRFRRYNNPIISADKAINLCTALVTMLAMETAMITAFGERGGKFAHDMLQGSGGTVCVVVLCIAVYMIVKGTSQLKKEELSDCTLDEI